MSHIYYPPLDTMKVRIMKMHNSYLSFSGFLNNIWFQAGYMSPDGYFHSNIIRRSYVYRNK